MKKITSTQYDRIEGNQLNSFVRIGWYNAERNCFEEVARWRNSFNKNSGANYGLLQVWSICFDFSAFESQGGYNTCGGYNKPIANLESCLWQFQKEHADFQYSSCGSIDSLLNSLKEYLQKQYKVKLFTIVNC